MKLGNFKSSSARSDVSFVERHSYIIIIGQSCLFFMAMTVKAFLGDHSFVLLGKLQCKESMSEQHLWQENVHRCHQGLQPF